MLTYITLGTNDLARAVAFYDSVLQVFGMSRCDTSAEGDWEGWAGWGTYQQSGQVQLALWVCQPQDGRPATAGNGTMVALRATSWGEVERAYETALANGGSSEGSPGLRLQYNPDFYAAYVRDPDGNKLAFVCRGFTCDQEA